VVEGTVNVIVKVCAFMKERKKDFAIGTKLWLAQSLFRESSMFIYSKK
jgi:hypothetical protein